MIIMKPGDVVQVELIVEHLRKGARRSEIMPFFKEKFPNTSTITFDRRMKQAKELMQQEIAIVEKQLTANIVKQVVKSKAGKILSTIERKQILSQIAQGKMRLRKPFVVDKKIKSISCVPDWMDRKSAIAELNKMDGAYAPTKISIDKVGLDAIEEEYK